MFDLNAHNNNIASFVSCPLNIHNDLYFICSFCVFFFVILLAFIVCSFTWKTPFVCILLWMRCASEREHQVRGMLLGFYCFQCVVVVFLKFAFLCKAFSAHLYGYRWVCNVLYKQYLQMTAHIHYAHAVDKQVHLSFIRQVRLLNVSILLFAYSFTLCFVGNLSFIHKVNCIEYILSAKTNGWFMFVIRNREDEYEIRGDAMSAAGRFVRFWIFFWFGVHCSLDLESNHYGTKVDSMPMKPTWNRSICIMLTMMIGKCAKIFDFYSATFKKNPRRREIDFIYCNKYESCVIKSGQQPISQIHCESAWNWCSRLFEHRCVLLSQFWFLFPCNFFSFFFLCLYFGNAFIWTSFFSRIS